MTWKNNNTQLTLTQNICNAITLYESDQLKNEYVPGPAEAMLFSMLKTLATVLKSGVTGNKEDTWFEDKLKFWKLNASVGLLEAPLNFTEKLVEIFSIEFGKWVKSKYNKDKFVYVATGSDLDALHKEVIPYLRIRSNKSSQMAIQVWGEIVDNFFASNLHKWDIKPPALKDIAANLMELELQPLGAARNPVVYGDEKTLVDVFLKHKPDGFYTARDVKMLLDCADDLQDAVDCVNWMFSDDVMDEYLKVNRPFTIGFILRCWRHYQTYKINKPDLAKQEAAKKQLLAKINKITK